MNMTKKEAIRIAQGLINDFKCESETMVEFCNVVIEALEQEPCEDYPSAQPTQSIAEWQKDFREYINMLNIPRDDYKGIMEYINDVPPVTPQNTKEIYNKGFADGQKALAEHLKLSKEELLDEIRAEITDWQTDIHDNENDAKTHDFVFERIYEILDEYKDNPLHNDIIVPVEETREIEEEMEKEL